MDLLGADGVHLLPHDLLDAPQHLQAEWQPRVDPRGDAADVACTDEQLVARHLRVGRVVAKRTQEQRRHPGEHPEERSHAAALTYRRTRASPALGQTTVTPATPNMTSPRFSQRHRLRAVAMASASADHWRCRS